MLEQIKYLLSKTGEGVINPVAYDTAIVACIESLDDSSEPEFPECLQWLRNKQLSDGSWGTESPTYAYGNVLCTLAAILSLKKWSQSDSDIKCVSKGVKSLQILSKRIKQEKYESIGYEIILPMLLIETKRLGIEVPVEWFDSKDMFEAKFASIKRHQQTYGWHRKHTFWFSLEMIAGLRHSSDRQLFALNDRLIEKNGSVCGSPSATAFYLASTRSETGMDAPSAHHYLRSLVKANGGGVPPLYPSDTFELSFCLSALLMAGMDANDPILSPAIDRLSLKWHEFNGFVGCSSYLPPDIDAIASFVYVLNSANRLQSNDSQKILLKFFNNNYFICFKDERNPSISVNINALIALKTYPMSKTIQCLISKVIDWLKSQMTDNAFIFRDKWHISPFYAISRAVFALEAIDDQLAQTCIDQMLSKQNIDFGWGISGSTLEETALVALALCYWYRTDSNRNNENNIKVLKSIQKFFTRFDGKRYVELWIAKSLYCPKHVTDVFITSAEYSLENTIKLLKLQ